jgi:hypothetical protein
MPCNIAAGEQMAAKHALSVSEKQLQLVKQQGCTTTQQDRSIMRLPDLRALPYPAFSDPIVELEFDTNNKYTAANQSEGFVHPFIDDVTAQDVIARPTVPSTGMAGTGDLAAIAGSMFAEEPDSRLYQRIADGIRGGQPRVSESSQTRQAPPPRAELEPHFAPNSPISTPQQVTAKLLYGSGRFVDRCGGHLRGALYDAMHYDAITPEMLREAGCRHRMGYLASREGRLPYLLFLLTALLLVLVVCRSL